MGIPKDYDDDAERVRTHPLLLLKPKEVGVVPSADLQVLANALGVKGKTHEESTPTVTPVQPGRRSVLDNEKFGPGNRPYWETKEGRAPFQYPDRSKALKSESGSSWRRQILTKHKTRIFGSSRGTVHTKVASQ